MKLDKSPFVVVSVIGQELLTASHHTASVVVLEAALKIGTCSLKLRGSVFSALSSAHWSLGNTEKSTGYMQQDLEVSKTLGKRSDRTGGEAIISIYLVIYLVSESQMCHVEVAKFVQPRFKESKDIEFWKRQNRDKQITRLIHMHI